MESTEEEQAGQFDSASEEKDDLLETLTYNAAKFLQVFKNKLKEWKPRSCPCRLCKTYIQHVGFI